MGEGADVPVELEQQSTAGKWILLFLAIIFVGGAIYGYVTTQKRVEKLTTGLSASQAQVAELQKRMQSAEAQRHILIRPRSRRKRRGDSQCEEAKSHYWDNTHGKCAAGDHRRAIEHQPDGGKHGDGSCSVHQ